MESNISFLKLKQRTNPNVFAKNIIIINNNERNFYSLLKELVVLHKFFFAFKGFAKKKILNPVNKNAARDPLNQMVLTVN